MMDVADLVESWQRGFHLEIPNDSYFLVVYDQDTQGVIAKEFIPVGSLIGEIRGDTIYIWDITHSNYLFIDEDIVLDVSAALPRTVLSFIRDDNQSNTTKNCMIQVQQDDITCQTRFFVYSTRDIYMGEELVNAVPLYR
jgi:hypothetical protein